MTSSIVYNIFATRRTGRKKLFFRNYYVFNDTNSGVRTKINHVC